MTDKRYKPIEQFIPNAHQKIIFDDYLISGSSGITGNKFGITRQRVHQIISLFGYKKPPKYRLSSEEKHAVKIAKQISLFWSHVDIKSDDACWEWKGGIYSNGYGHSSSVSALSAHTDQYAHRVAWILSFGEIPKEMSVLHNCDNCPCCNPHHLYLGTQQDNVNDREERFYKNGKVARFKKDRKEK